MTATRKILTAVGALVVLALGALAWHIWPAFSPPQHIEVAKNRYEKTLTALSGIMGEKGAVLVLVRSADWCPFCKVQLSEHAGIAPELEARGYTLASLSYDEPEKLADFAAGLDQSFVMLSDTESQFIDAVELRDPQYGPDHFAYGVPRASVLVLEPDGTIAAKLVSSDYRQRPSNDFVLEMVDRQSD